MNTQGLISAQKHSHSPLAFPIAIRVFSVAFFILFWLILPPAFSQNRIELEKQKANIISKIKEIEGILSKTTQEKQTTLSELNSINKQVETQQELISSINQEVRLLDREIKANLDKITALERELDNLKSEYAAMIYATSKSQSGVNELMYLFSSKSFYQFYMRYKYMQQYGDARRKQAETITRVQESLREELLITQKKREEQNQLLREQLAQNQTLQGLKKKQQDALTSLSKRETQLKKDLTERKNSVEKLNTLIADVVKREMERRATASSNVSEADSRNLEEENIRLSAVFSDNKNKLPWPVKSGFVSQKFGNQPHPTLRGITIPNDGVDIRTEPNAIVRSVFDGEVTSIASVPGMNTVVIIKHGEYYSVYARLEKVFVKNGQKINAMESIGELHTSSNGLTEIQFQIWKSTQAQNPQDWLIRK
ncbi:murein hydrolase activator EnvC family protein [Fulvivirgaceae bacterium LMO-SS25]